MDESSLKMVRFDLYCKSCDHYSQKFPKENISSEAQEPCNTCLEISAREGTRKPEYYKER